MRQCLHIGRSARVQISGQERKADMQPFWSHLGIILSKDPSCNSLGFCAGKQREVHSKRTHKVPSCALQLKVHQLQKLKPKTLRSPRSIENQQNDRAPVCCTREFEQEKTCTSLGTHAECLLSNRTCWDLRTSNNSFFSLDSPSLLADDHLDLGPLTILDGQWRHLACWRIRRMACCKRTLYT